MLRVALKVLCASVVMGMVCWVSNGFIEKDLLGTEGIVSRMLNVFLPIGFSILTLAGMYKSLKVSEFDDILNIVKQRLKKSN